MNLRKALIIGLVLGAFCVTSAMAVEGGNPKKGKYLFKKNCKSCHVEGAEGGAVTPMNKTMSQWDRFFEKAKHPAEGWENVKEADLLHINQYLFDHAADSDQPETCG